MLYEFEDGRRVPVVYCGNCGEKMGFADSKFFGKNTLYRMVCSETCRSWCDIQFDKIVDYGIFQRLSVLSWEKMGKSGNATCL